MRSRVLFLDYDGVVNRSIWNEKGTKYFFGYPEDGAVNDFQAVQWVSEFCARCKYDIVVTSTWRKYGNWKECLIAGGLREGIEVQGKYHARKARACGKNQIAPRPVRALQA